MLKNIANNFTNVIKKHGHAIGTTMEVAHAISSALAEIKEKPGAITIAKASFKCIKDLLPLIEGDSSEYFSNDNWAVVAARFKKCLYDLLKSFNCKFDLHRKGEYWEVWIADVEGEKIGFLIYDGTIQGAYFKKYREKETRDAIRNLFWHKFRGCDVLMTSGITGNKRDSIDSIVFEKDDEFSLPETMFLSEKKAYFETIMTKHNWSVMFYGPPGTGKSTLARALLKELKLSALRIRVQDLSFIDNSSILLAIEFIKPAAIILDDLDRASFLKGDQLLEFLEVVHRHVKLTVSTANNKGLLNQAMRRPGRIDDLFEISAPDPNVIKEILGQKYANKFENVKKWPVSYIVSYVDKVELFPKKEEEIFKDLDSRVKDSLEEYYDGEGEETNNSDNGQESEDVDEE